jgi:hypothetical protein
MAGMAVRKSAPLLPHKIIFLAALCLAVRAATLPASAQPLNRLPPARAPCTVLSGRPCHPSFCDIFHHGPCFPQYGPAIGSDFRLTIVSTDTEPGGEHDQARDQDAGQGTANPPDTPADKTLKSMRAMYAALRACWVPPPKDEARHGMQYTVRLAFKRDGDIIGPPFVTYASRDAPPAVRDIYRDAVNAALARCTPLHFSDDMAEAVVGHPIAIRFVDDRTIDNQKSLQ